ncbi:mandelate racemase/muconate lactonizing enzyme family protein [Bosea sp. SSUT16]|jgi:galactonate dehydratase|uniref:Mandelate racemase/muconate lactonizing enzyme family protein n=1 Tax=Bosea spartocytisi TaxID=2773451 RepID=A0A927ED27_9HYPH|nr:mandelate racemase/muconate lactonizing enzyme family protein [Bosea spartocytisi]MBD3846469.1 mandelate racemase/muconate lactonizing enzyme family protein [Bosea spartocytisi]MCT4472015.1 mandelate racemase/muconate lactonizing enzyme family protein [Bosea spartocytisi]
MAERVAKVDVYTLTIPRETVYLGDPRPGENVNEKGYIVRKGNRTVYPTMDRTVVVRLETSGGLVGWGETYGIVAPGAAIAIIDDLLGPYVIGRSPQDVVVIHEDLYDLMRVRGYTGGFYLDALAAIDIALWDLNARLADRPLVAMLGGRRHERLPAYISGLPKRTRAERADFAAEWQAKGFDSFKFAAPVADDGNVAEIATLRERLGSQARIACDMHWVHTAEEAVSAIRAMEPHGLWFAEAPVKPEDVDGLTHVAARVSTPVAAGEEWRTVYDLVPRVARRACAIVQPEMGHKGVTEFMRIGQYAQAHNLAVIPHATIGMGLFMAASLHASAALSAVSCHEYQHSIFEPNRRLLTGDMDCHEGFYSLPTGPGLGVAPSEEALNLLRKH